MVSGPIQTIARNIDTLSAKAEKLQPVFAKFRDYGTWIAGAGVAGALGLSVAVTQFANLEEAQLNLRTLLMDSTGQVGAEYGKLNTLAESLGTSLPGSTKDMLEMFTALREQGVQTNVILGGMGEASAKFAVLMKVPFAQAATHVAKFTEALGIADKEAVPFMDILQRLKGAAGVNVSDMSESLKYMGSTLKSLRVQGLEAGRDVSAAIGLMATSSIEGSQAGTNFAQALSRFAEVGSRLGGKKMMQEIAPLLNAKGIKLNLFDTGGNFVGIRAMMGEMEKLRKLNPQNQLLVLSKLFGTEASRPLSVFINQGVSGFDQMLLKMKNQADMQTKINEIMSGAKMQWETLTGTVANVVAHIGGVVTKSAGLVGIMKTVNNLAGKLDSWIVANPQTAGIIAGVAIALTITALAAGGLLLTIGIMGALVTKSIVGFGMLVQAVGLNQLAVTGLIGKLSSLSAAGMWAWIKTAVSGMWAWANSMNTAAIPALRNMAIATWRFTLAVLANPLTWWVVGIAAVIAGMVWLYKHVEAVTTAVDFLAFAIGLGLGFAFKAIVGLYQIISQPILAIQALWWFLGEFFKNYNAFKFLADVIKEFAGKMFAWGVGFLMGFVNGIKSRTLAIVGAIVGVISGAGQILGRINLFTSGARIIQTLVAGIKSVAMAPVQAITGIFAKVRNLLPFSDAKEGPLSQLTLSGSRIMSTLSDGIIGAAPGLHQTMAGALAGAALATSIAVTPVPALADMAATKANMAAPQASSLLPAAVTALPANPVVPPAITALPVPVPMSQAHPVAGLPAAPVMPSAVTALPAPSALPPEIPAITLPPAAVSTPQQAAAPRPAAAVTAAASAGKQVTIQSLTVQINSVADANDFIAQLQSLVEGHDA